MDNSANEYFFKMSNFQKWLVSNGAAMEKVFFDQDSNGLGGGFAKEQINPDEVFATIPFNITLNREVALKNLPSLGAMNFSCRTLLATFLINEKSRGSKSFYYPYIDILPSHVPTPLWFDEHQMRWLKGTNLEKGVHSRKEMLIKEYQQIKRYLPENLSKDIFTWEAYLWACDILSSRGFPGKLVMSNTCDQSSEVLLPLADSFNHRSRQKITLSIHNETLKLVAGEKILPGSQIWSNYGPKSNEELLLGYGFCLPNNPDDWVIVKVNFSHDPQREIKLRILEQTNLLDLVHFIKPNFIPTKLLSQLRILVMTSVEAARYKNIAVDHEFEFIGYRNEIAMLESLKLLLSKKLVGLNDKLLGDAIDGMPEPIKIYRKGQKEILKCALDTIEIFRNSILARAFVDFQSNRISTPPFLQIDNRMLENTNLIDDLNHQSKTMALASDLFINVPEALKINPEFYKVVNALFQDPQEEEDTVLMLYLIAESHNSNSKWASFFTATQAFAETNIIQHERLQDLNELFLDIGPSLIGLSSKLFPQQIVTLEKFLWSATVLDTFSVNFFYEGDQRIGIVPL
ncbi:hypothetical protein G9A89_021482 [Geosiphon pyriformis]|nr:hypothetical protein G9A89_021482 [Geosiphon pyriformis]